MLTLRVLENDCTVNNLAHKSAVKIGAGESIIVRLQLWQPDRNLRFIPSSDATITITLRTSDPDVTISKEISWPFASDDRSIIDITLEAEETPDIISQNIVAQISQGGSIFMAVLQNGISKVVLQGGC